MTPAQVLDVLARLEVAYRTELTDPERRLWVEELEPYDAALVAAAAEDRITSSSPFMPKVGEIIAAVREARAEVPVRERPALPAGEWVETMPDEVREKVHELVERFDPATAIVDEEVEWKRSRAKLAALPRLRGVCSGIGKRAVELDGVLVCPDCRSPVADGCRPGGAA